MRPHDAAADRLFVLALEHGTATRFEIEVHRERKYAVQVEAMGVPDPARLRFREALNEAVDILDRAAPASYLARRVNAGTRSSAHSPQNTLRLVSRRVNVLKSCALMSIPTT